MATFTRNTRNAAYAARAASGNVSTKNTFIVTTGSDVTIPNAFTRRRFTASPGAGKSNNFWPNGAPRRSVVKYHAPRCMFLMPSSVR